MQQNICIPKNRGVNNQANIYHLCPIFMAQSIPSVPIPNRAVVGHLSGKSQRQGFCQTTSAWGWRICQFFQIIEAVKVVPFPLFHLKIFLLSCRYFYVVFAPSLQEPHSIFCVFETCGEIRDKSGRSYFPVNQ